MTAQHNPGGHRKEELARAIRRLALVTSGTGDLLTLYIPPDRTPAEVRAYLDQEDGARSPNSGRETTVPAIARAGAFLRTLERIPANGLAIFCGHAITGGDGCETIEPPARVRDFFLRVSTRFDPGPLARMLEEEATGLILLDLDQAYWALIRSGEPGPVGRIGSTVPSRHHKGGQSAARFQRLREIAAREFYTRVGDHAGTAVLAGTAGGKELSGVLIGGQRPATVKLASGSYLPAPIRQKILGVVDQAAIGPDGLRELAKKAEELVRERKAAADRRIVDEFLDAQARGGGRTISGEAAVREHLAAGSVGTLLVSSSLRTSGTTVTCSICGHSGERTIRLGAGESVADILAHTCRFCDAPLIGDPAVDPAGELEALALGSGARTVIVPAETGTGSEFARQTGGVGAVLRYRTGA